jgi:radical SAM-linked protein
MSSEPTGQPQRLRIIFGKMGAFKYIGHLDLAKTWERILRRAQLGLAYTHGFNARPRMQLAAPLPLGLTSECEILDVWLEKSIPVEGLAGHLMAVSPAGLPIYQVFEVPARAAALQTLVASATYRIAVSGVDREVLQDRVTALLGQEHVLRTRRGKAYDLRPLILSLRVDDSGTLLAELAIDQRGTGRPDELVEALGIDPTTTTGHRMAIALRATPAEAPAQNGTE